MNALKTKSISKNHISTLIKQLKTGIFERNEAIAVALLAALADQNIFLLGPAGTAKSLVSRRLSCAFKQADYFETLLHRFSTPEEIFGPISIAALKDDRYLRKTDHFLPTAQFAFLDEIWRGSPAILNSLLTIINEKRFHNGTLNCNVPLKAVICASNDIPEHNESLAALYDRFLVRLSIMPLDEPDNFNQLLQSHGATNKVEIADEWLITTEQWDSWQAKIDLVQLSRQTLDIIHAIRVALEQRSAELAVYVSDRRWQKAAKLLKAAAFFNGRDQTHDLDALLLRHCLWTSHENQNEVMAIIEAAVITFSFTTTDQRQRIDKQIDLLKQKITTSLFWSKDTYQTTTLDDGKSYFEYDLSADSDDPPYPIFVAEEVVQSKQKVHPLDEQGNRLVWLKCHFTSNMHCIIQGDGEYSPPETLLPIQQNKKGDKKTNMEMNLIPSLHRQIADLTKNIKNIMATVQLEIDDFNQRAQTPFIPISVSNGILNHIKSQQTELNNRIQHCGQLTHLIESDNCNIEMAL
ncbi:MAG: MoxR-like ATPase [Phenylobacterium sp.]|jgi:MoxR-like ATPase